MRPQFVHAYVGTAGHSAWFSEDLGTNWVHPNSHSGMYLEARVWCFSSHSAQPGHLYAGTDMGVFCWQEGPARWEWLSSPMNDVWALAQDPSAPDTLIAGTRPAAFFKSTDAGKTWSQTTAPGIAQFSDVNQGPTRVTQILFDPVVRGRVWATVEIGGIYVSDDAGQTWRLRDSGLISVDMHGIAVVQGPKQKPIVFATSNKGLHRSDDQGENWQFQELDSPWQYTRCIQAHATRPGVLYLTNGNGPPGNDGKFFISENHGADWREVALDQEPNSTIWCIAQQPQYPDLMLIASNLGQVYRSDNGGRSFQRLAHEFGEIRSIHLRVFDGAFRHAAHSVTRQVLKAREMLTQS